MPATLHFVRDDGTRYPLPLDNPAAAFQEARSMSMRGGGGRLVFEAGGQRLEYGAAYMGSTSVGIIQAQSWLETARVRAALIDQTEALEAQLREVQHHRDRLMDALEAVVDAGRKFTRRPPQTVDQWQRGAAALDQALAQAEAAAFEEVAPAG